MKELQQRIQSSAPVAELRKIIRQLSAGEAANVSGTAGSLGAFLLTSLFDDAGQVFCIEPDNDRAEQLRDDCALLLGEERVRFFGARPSHEGQALDLRGSISQAETLNTLMNDSHHLIIASAESAVQKLPAPGAVRSSRIELKSGSEYPFTQFIARLESLGFDKKEFVETYGDFAVRGGIIDVFPFSGENPIRLEFWGDSLESMREFDVLSQRSIRTIRSTTILPSLGNVIPSSDGSGAETGGMGYSIFEYLQDDTLVVLASPSLIEREIHELAEEGIENIFSSGEIFARAGKFRLVVESVIGNESIPGIPTRQTVDFRSTPQPSFNGSVLRLVEFLSTLSRDGYSLYVSSDTAQECDRLRELIEDVLTDPDAGGTVDRRPLSGSSREHSPQAMQPIDPHVRELPLRFLVETTHTGFVIPAQKIALVTEHEVFGRVKRRGLEKRRRFRGFSQKELQQLRPGDFIVHVDHGIGIFDGLTRLRVGGIEQEVLKLLFLDEDVLYVNLNFLNRVQKYSSQEGYTPTLSRLGGLEWDKAKARAKGKLKDIARDIIALYAKRKREQGFAFSKDTHWQKELEASFMYDDTPDQASATLAVKQDMEDPAPMDRLICGDVGFGKTEVAVRAAFKAVMSGKQATVLVPTTILAIQHFHTFRDRLSRYTVNVDHLTRFRSQAEQRQILNQMKKGGVDIVIGTHRLLSKDIGFKDLGLLIIDEEHRFGVAAKEKLRRLKSSIDTLSLTATPIPRTLHFSLIGARDLSLIATAPRNRLPIVTEIIPADTTGKQVHWNIVREAILRETHRGGQVYFVHDRVENIDAIAAQVRSQVPSARVHVAHGQMAGHELEKSMLGFLEKKYDVLVATKIIESGLDIPNVNTIIVNRADRFGLAELYQLRGRVGRSNVQAYAYLLVPPLSIVPRQTLRRLQAIEEFTELGSGFNLAMRDLEIRGAGNLLGAEQSGFIMEMGFELYERILREAVEELKSEEFEGIFRATSAPVVPALREATIESDIEAIIPGIYIESDIERLDIYRRISKAVSADELKTLTEELRDRFGEFPEEVEHLFALAKLRLTASVAGFQKIGISGLLCTITLPPESDQSFYGSAESSEAPFVRMVKMINSAAGSRMKLVQEGKQLQLVLPLRGKNPAERISRSDEMIRDLLNILNPSPANIRRD